MIKLTHKQNYHHLINQKSSSVLIIYHHLNQFIFHCLLILSLICSIQSELNLTTSTKAKSLLSTTPINFSDLSDDLTTTFTFLNPVTLVNNNATSDTESTIIDLSTDSTIKGNNLTDNNQIDSNETTTIITIKQPSPVTTINPSHVTLFLDGDDEVNTLSSTIKFNDDKNLTDNDSINSNEIINSSSSSQTINSNFISKSLANIKDNQQETTTPTTITINLNQLSSESIDNSETTTLLTIDLSNNETVNSSSTINKSNNETTLSSSSDLLIDTSNQTICDSNNNQRLTIDHYQAKKFFLFTMILLGLCCLLVLIVLILVVYIFRKLTRERTIKIPQVNNNNHFGGGGSIEFDTIKDGRFYQWQGNVNSGFDSTDLNESTTQSTGYRFLEGSVVPYGDRYHTDMIKTSSTETFGHPNNQQQQQSNHNNLSPNQSSLSTSVNSLPKSSITTVDTRL